MRAGEEKKIGKFFLLSFHCFTSWEACARVSGCLRVCLCDGERDGEESKRVYDLLVISCSISFSLLLVGCVCVSCLLVSQCCLRALIPSAPLPLGFSSRR